VGNFFLWKCAYCANMKGNRDTRLVCM